MSWSWPFKRSTKQFGGYSYFAIITVLDGRETIYKTYLRSDKAFNLAKSVWKNNQPLDEVWVVNMNTGVRRDILKRECDG